MKLVKFLSSGLEIQLEHKDYNQIDSCSNTFP